MAAKNTRLENQILHFSKQGKWDKVEGLWTQFSETPPNDPKVFATLAKRAVKDEKTEELRSWFLMLVETCHTLDNNRAVIQASRGVLRHMPEYDELREPLLKSLRAQYAKTARLEEIIEASGLNREAALDVPLRRLLRFVRCAEGEVFQHAEWGEGVVKSIDLDEGRVEINFPEIGTKSFTFDGVTEFLKRLPKKHLFAQRILRPDHLRQRAEENPVDFLKFCLKCLGGSASRSDLKEHLTRGVFNDREWNKWWSTNRDALRFDPYIAVGGSTTNPSLQLRETPRKLYDETADELADDQLDFNRVYALVTDVLKLHKNQPVEAEQAQRILNIVQEKFNTTAKTALARRLEYLYLIEDTHKTLGVSCDVMQQHTADQFIGEAKEPAALVCSLSMPDNQTRAASELKKHHADDWADRAEEIFMAAPSRLSQWILRDLIEAGNVEAASHMAEQLMHRPYENPDVFLWLVRAIRDEKLPELHVEVSPQELMGAVLEVIEDAHKRIGREDRDTQQLKGLVSRLQNFLMERHFELPTEVFESYDGDQARQRYKALINNPAFAESFKIALDQVLRSRRSDLDDDSETDTTGASEHLVTQESFKARQAEYHHIKNVEIPENSEAIGTAAAMGDLSENAEYESAKERQKVLFRRLESLEDLLQRARVMQPEDINTEQIGFGTHFRIKNLDSGEIEEYTLLGLWDADPENYILSYITPFGRQFLKRKPGDVIVVVRPGGGSTQYKVLELKNALTKDLKSKSA